MDDRERDNTLREVVDQVDSLQLTTLTGLQKVELQFDSTTKLFGLAFMLLGVLTLISLLISTATFLIGNSNRALIYDIERTRVEQQQQPKPLVSPEQTRTQ